jgi:hypothetical protein
MFVKPFDQHFFAPFGLAIDFYANFTANNFRNSEQFGLIQIIPESRADLSPRSAVGGLKAIQPRFDPPALDGARWFDPG